MSTLSPKGRALVQAGRRAFRPTDEDRVRLLDALRTQLGDSALPADISPVASAASAGRALWPIISAVVVGVGLVGGALFFARHRGAEPNLPQAPAFVPVVAAPQVIEPVVVPPVEQPAAILSDPASLPLPAANSHRPQDRLAAEVAILSRATRDLHAGRAAEALKALDEYRRKFPKGLLGEEQRAASAQALCALGRFDEANARLAGLPPESPLAARAKQFCDASLRAR